MTHMHAETTNTSRTIRIWGWVGAAVALATSLVHLPMLGDNSWVVSLIVAAMLIGCAHCSVCLFRNPTVSAWLRTAAMGAIMIALHPVLMSAMDSGMAGMDHSMPGMDMGAMGHSMSSMQPWMTLMIVFAAAEIVVAAAALGWMALRGRVAR